MEKIVNVTEKASAEIKRVLENEEEGKGIRLGVRGGGCSGLSYVLDFGTQKEDDVIQEEEGYKIFVDPKSSLYLKDTQLDYNDDLQSRGFKFSNPNASNLQR
jgi:iron-sulfur cluster assembly protein